MWACPSRTRTVNHACTHARYRCRRLCRLELPRRTQRALGMQRTGGSVGERPRAHGRGGPRRASAASRDARGAAHMLLSSTSSRGRAACLATSYTESTVLLDPAVAHSVRRCHDPWGPQCAAKIPSHAPARGSGHAVLRFPRASAGAGGGGWRRWGEAGHKLAPQARLRWRGATHRGPRRLRRTLGPPYRAERLPRTLLSSRSLYSVPGAGARADSRDIHHEALSAARSGAVAAGTACHPQARAQAAHTGGAAPCPPNGTAGCCVRVPPAELGVSSVLRVIGCSGARRRVQPMTGGAPPLTGRARSARTAATTRRFTAGASRLRCVGMAQGAASLRECVGVSRVACRVRAATHHGPARWKSTSAAEVLLAPTRF